MPQTARLALSLGACALIVLGFFLPWFEGTAEFATRDFSGFDLARLVRNFEITAGSASDTGQLRATAVALYLVPALAANGALLQEVALFIAGWRAAARFALLSASVYTSTVLASLLALSLLPINDFESVVGAPMYGFALSGGGAFVLAWIGLSAQRSP